MAYGVAFKGLGVALPERVIHNDELTQLVDTSDEWINSRTGFRERRVVSGDEKMTDLAIESARNALAFAGMQAEDIDLIIVASSTPDAIYPAACCVVQHAIGATRAFGFDIAMGCSGLIYAIGIASQFLENGTVRNALIIGSDTHSRYTDWSDRNTCVLFGDGAGALVLTRTETAAETELLAMDMMLEGWRGAEIRLPINRDNCPLVDPRGELEKSAIYMNGREVFKFAVGEVPKIILNALEKGHLSVEDIDYFVLHQANARIMSAMAERLNAREEQMVLNVEHYSNTSAASIPLALYDAIQQKLIQPGAKLVLCGFGAGLAVATAVVNWTCVDQRSDVAAVTAGGRPIGKAAEAVR